MKVRPKKYLGQHFLTCAHTAEKISDILNYDTSKTVLEIGAGTGMLTQFLLQKPAEIYAVELDKESVRYLAENFPDIYPRIFCEDFLNAQFTAEKIPQPFSVIGNFPYNISSQIVFKILELRIHIPEFGGMFQKEVAERIAAPSGSKTYGILSVLTQAFYEVSYLFTVSPYVFKPPPKVDSGVIICKRYRTKLPVSASFFQQVVKTAFGQRRKTLRNSLKKLVPLEYLKQDAIFAKRPEQISVQDFINLTAVLSKK